MSQQYIEVVIDTKTGEVKVEAHGYSGTGCVKDVDKIMEGLTGKNVMRKNKPEYYRGNRVSAKTQKQQKKQRRLGRI